MIGRYPNVIIAPIIIMVITSFAPLRTNIKEITSKLKQLPKLYCQYFFGHF